MDAGFLFVAQPFGRRRLRRRADARKLRRAAASFRRAPRQAGAKPPGVASVDGASIELAAFQNSAFPYHGLIPNYQETGKTRPFLDVDDNGRLGHSSPRGGLLWEDQAYNDRTVLLAAPETFDPSRPGYIVVFFHGNNATLERDVIARQQIVRQLADSGLNAVLVAPQLAHDAPDSSAGKFWSPGGFAAFLDEAERKLGDFYPNARGAFRRMPVIVVAYSGGYLPAAYSLTVGGDAGRVSGVVLLDALYGERDKFVSWIEGPAATPSSSAPIRPLRRTATWRSEAELQQAGLTVAGQSAGEPRSGRDRLRRRGQRRPQRFRHLRLGRRPAARHLFAHPLGTPSSNRPISTRGDKRFGKPEIYAMLIYVKKSTRRGAGERGRHGRGEAAEANGHDKARAHQPEASGRGPRR